MDRSKTIALVLGPSLAVLALLAGYFWKDRVSSPGTPLELHGGAGASSQQATADVAANAGSLSPIEPKPEKPVPQFDVVRVEPKGDALVAGRTQPNAKVAVLSDGKVIVEGKADANGQFALLPPKLEPGGHNLALQSTSPEGGAPVQSDQRVVVYVPREKGEEVAVALAEPGKPTLLLQDPTAAAEKADATVPDMKTVQPLTVPQPEVAQAPAAREAPPVTQAAPAKPQVKQPPATAKNKVAAKPEATAVKPESFAAKMPSEAKPELPGKDEPIAQSEPTAKVLDLRPSVSIKTAEVVEPGGFFASGQAAQGAQVRLYLNGSLLAEVLAGKDGHWSMKVGKGLIPGQYAVRADQVDGKGQVLARAEVLFLYKNEPKLADKTSQDAQPESTASTPEVATNGKATSAKPENAVVAEIQTTTVERGNNLWRISRHTLGRGTRYTEIYAANATQIRDPKLIYPGQVFVIPGQIN